jgi:hypothetical protein
LHRELPDAPHGRIQLRLDRIAFSLLERGVDARKPFVTPLL